MLWDFLIKTGSFKLANPCKKIFTLRDYSESRNFQFLGERFSEKIYENFLMSGKYLGGMWTFLQGQNGTKNIIDNTQDV